MWNGLEKEIRAEARKLIRRHERYMVGLSDDHNRRVRRSHQPVRSPDIKRPSYWDDAPGFDPYRVRARAESIAHSVRRRLAAGTYEPFAPAEYSVPKEGEARQRSISVFQVADATVSLMLYRGLLAKNLPKLSQRAYAYRADRSGVDALMYLRDEFAGRQRVYIAEYDFSKFFDTIDHHYVLRTLRDDNYLVTPQEARLIETFLYSRMPASPYRPDAPERRRVGLPQGTSLSLFLANVAATPIDRRLERIGVGFVRYADDTVLFDNDYSRISRAVEALHDLSAAMGVEINRSKSAGIRLLVPDDDAAAEFPATTKIDYLGHQLTTQSVAFKSHVVERVKRKITQLIYDNLLREPLKGTQDMGRITETDRDYVTLIWQLRRYFYGNLSEREVRRFVSGAVPRRRFIGLMSHFPLLDDQAQLSELDGWVSSQAWLALRKRAQLLGIDSSVTPHGIDLAPLRNLRARSSTTGDLIDLRIPSLGLMANVVRRAVQIHGASVVVKGGSEQYAYD